MHARSLLVSAVLALGLAVAAHAETPLFDLCIEQSPAKAGRVTPDSGTHRFSANSVVMLAAEPQQGYQFAYWLGDVADPTAKRTSVQVDSPKVVIAIFKRAERDPLQKSFGGGGGGGELAATAIDFSIPTWSPSGGSEPDTPDTPPIHTPEPATLAMLALGALTLRRFRTTDCCRAGRSPGRR
jgi:hypothetical protein